jgi:hypothetical protein
LSNCSASAKPQQQHQAHKHLAALKPLKHELENGLAAERHAANAIQCVGQGQNVEQSEKVD